MKSLILVLILGFGTTAFSTEVVNRAPFQVLIVSGRYLESAHNLGRPEGPTYVSSKGWLRLNPGASGKIEGSHFAAFYRRLDGSLATLRPSELKEGARRPILPVNSGGDFQTQTFTVVEPMAIHMPGQYRQAGYQYTAFEDVNSLPWENGKPVIKAPLLADAVSEYWTFGFYNQTGAPMSYRIIRDGVPEPTTQSVDAAQHRFHWGTSNFRYDIEFDESPALGYQPKRYRMETLKVVIRGTENRTPRWEESRQYEFVSVGNLFDLRKASPGLTTAPAVTTPAVNPGIVMDPPQTLVRIDLSARERRRVDVDGMRIVRIQGRWAVDAAKAPVDPMNGHTGDVELEKYSNYKLNPSYPFGLLMVFRSGRWSPLRIGDFVSAGDQIQINDSSLQDNAGSIQIELQR